MAAEELENIQLIADLSNRALQQYEGLQKKHETAAAECRRLQEERDEAVKRLNEFQKVSQMVVEEVSAIQENLEIERTCRQSAEVLASKLNQQNRSLKRKSMMLLSHLSPETITEICLEEQEQEEEEVCLSAQCHTTISELQLQLESTLKEKNEAVSEAEAVKEELRETREQLLKEKQDNMVLITENLQQKKLLAKYNRVSRFAVEEFQVLQETLNLEQDLRTEAENFARAMLVDQKKLKRQSQILLQNSAPGAALQEALSQVAGLTQNLETQKLEHQKQIQQMEDRLSSCRTQKELTALRCKLELVEEEKRENREKLSNEIKDLRFTVEELQKKLQAATNPPPAPAPPPPPPPPPPPVASAPASNPLSALLSLIRKKKDVGPADIPLEVQDTAETPVDVRQQAVDEMMQRIKKGVKLRPVGQSPSRRRRRVETQNSNSAIQELKGIMENFQRRPPPTPPQTPSPPEAARDHELQRILLRRRDAVEPQHDTSLVFSAAV